MKIKNKSIIAITVIFFLLALTACQRGNNSPELERYIKELKERIFMQENKKSSEKIPSATPVRYEAERMRDPFENSETVKTNKDTTSPLNAFPLMTADVACIFMLRMRVACKWESNFASRGKKSNPIGICPLKCKKKRH